MNEEWNCRRYKPLTVWQIGGYTWPFKQSLAYFGRAEPRVKRLKVFEVMAIETGAYGAVLFEKVAKAGWLEPMPKRIRAIANDEIIADSTDALLLLEYGRMPTYLLPMADVRMDLLEESDKETDSDDKGKARFWNLKVGDKLEKNAAWCYPEAPAPIEHLAKYIAFKWRAMDTWLEEDEEVIDHPRQPYHRVDILRSQREVTVEHGGVVLAKTSRALFIYETAMLTRYYIPETDINMEYLEPSSHHTGCPYKGTASYWNINSGEKKIRNGAWAYPNPLAGAERLAGHIAFYNEKVDRITVDGKQTNA